MDRFMKKMYIKPAVEVVELMNQTALLAGSAVGSISDDPFGGDAGTRELEDFNFLLNGDDPMKMLLP